MLKKFSFFLLLLGLFFSNFLSAFQISFAADTTTGTNPTPAFQPVADAPESSYFKRIDNPTSIDGGAGTSYIQDTISNTRIINAEAREDIKQAEKDAQTVYATAIQNGKSEDIAKQQSYNILKAGSALAVAKQANDAGGNGGYWENLGNFVGYTGTTEERLAKLSEADAAYKKSLVEAYNEVGDINKYGQADYNANSAAAFKETADQARAGVFTVGENSNSSSGIGNELAKAITPGNGSSYSFLAPLPFFPGGSIDIRNGGLGGYLNGLYKAGIAIATGLALIMIVVGGLEYVSVDSLQGKSNGKARIQNAIVGLLLALASYIILQQVNPNLLKSDMQVADTSSVGGIQGSSVRLAGEVAPVSANNNIISGGGSGIGNGGSGGVFSGASSVTQLMNSLPNGSRSSDGSLIFTNYWNGDTNTNQKRGNNCNLLVDGSVALSPDIIRDRSPLKASGVFVDGLLIGYFDDTTASTTPNGVKISNTIDIYDPNRKYGTMLKKIPPGSWNLTFGSGRAQTPNPCPGED